ncbi:MAG: hypothetical protein FJ090_21890 [Deltaproteobacteria bacterium]|nr:hypothetical protein [Deltaproteobacteria bacterium]
MLEIAVDGPADVRLSDPAGRVLDGQLWQSGEVYVDLLPHSAEDTDVTVLIACAEECTRKFTRYPIVMLHGLGAAGIFDGVDYFFGVRDRLEGRGYLVRNPSVDPFESTEVRAGQIAAILDGYLAEGIGPKLNLIAHSQGGLDARYLVGAMGWGDRIASIDMIATPNRGTVIADVLSGTYADGPVDEDLVDLGAAAFASLYGLEADGSLTTSISSLSTAAVAALNEAAPDDPRVYYSSWAGVSCALLDQDCQDAHGGETVEPLLDPLFLIAQAQGYENDGLVPVDSVPWGDHQGTIDADHADEIGQFEDIENPAFDHLAFYDAEIERLAGLGF